MPRVYDNIETHLLEGLLATLRVSGRADFCVGYFNLRGWKKVADEVEAWQGGEGSQVRLLVGMQRAPEEAVHAAFGVTEQPGVDQAAVVKLKRQAAQQFREQLTWGVPTSADEAGLRRLAHQLDQGKVAVKLFLRHPLHAKLYLLFRDETVNPITGFVGSSNLTLAGLQRQGELNLDVQDHDACTKLSEWFDDRWGDSWCLDISDELARIIRESWASEEPVKPYHIYIKMAYHLSREAQEGMAKYHLPPDFGATLFEFQDKAVKIAAHHVNHRGGAMIGDVVGLGKTLMATALARVLEEELGFETLILCPKNLVKMWEHHKTKYRLRGATVMSLSRVIRDLPDTIRHRIVLIDESHNLRTRGGKRYNVIRDWIQKNESRVILLSATPYNKTYRDLSNQLRFFIPEHADLGIRPENYIRSLGGEPEFGRKHPTTAARSLAAFEHSQFADDWRELMRLFLVRRTRGFIEDNYAELDETTDRKYLKWPDGSRQYFPARIPKSATFTVNDSDPQDQYAALHSTAVVTAINQLDLPRYGLANFIQIPISITPAPAEADLLDDLSRAGRRLMGFCRTNLFKRLESSGSAFLISLERHILRNSVVLHALRSGQPVPIGPQDLNELEQLAGDEDTDSLLSFDSDDEPETIAVDGGPAEGIAARAARIYETMHTRLKRRYGWLPTEYFSGTLQDSLQRDNDALLAILISAGEWEPDRDAKLKRLVKLIQDDHPGEKILVFSQFADTVRYLESQLIERGIRGVVGVTGDTSDPTSAAWRFSPVSNEQPADATDGIRVLIATDVLSEGQNLQDAHIVVNYDLPWAIIRLIQRAGRVDRIGQQSPTIMCYSFLIADGVERIINLRSRVRQRLRENAEVVGTDESFFEGEKSDSALRDLFTEKSGLLDGDTGDGEVDLESRAYQIWKNAIDQDPTLEKRIKELADVVCTGRHFVPGDGAPEGAILYVRTANGTDALAWVDRQGRTVSESQLAILKVAECGPDEPPVERLPEHHQLIAEGVKAVAQSERTLGGSLGRASGAKARAYDRLMAYAQGAAGLFATDSLAKVLEDLLKYPLRETARDHINELLRRGGDDPELAALVIRLRDENRLSVIHDDDERREPRIICSMGMIAAPRD